MRFEIPQIIWEKDGNEYVSKNTFFEYVIRPNGLCKYDEGKFKECRSVDDAMDWVETVHYPDQVKKYFGVFSPSDDEIKAVLLANGFKEKEQADGTMDLNQYVYTAVRELLR